MCLPWLPATGCKAPAAAFRPHNADRLAGPQRDRETQVEHAGSMQERRPNLACAAGQVQQHSTNSGGTNWTRSVQVQLPRQHRIEGIPRCRNPCDFQQTLSP